MGNNNRDVSIPVARNDEPTLKERLSENAYNSIIPARYLRKDSNGEPIEEQEELFERVAHNIALAELAHTDEEIEIEPEWVRDDMDHPFRIENGNVLSTNGDRASIHEDNVRFLDLDMDDLTERGYNESANKLLEVYCEFRGLMERLKLTPNTPTLANAGDSLQQCSACFVLSPSDDMSDIHDKVREASLIHQSGGGTGYSFSRLRPYGDIVKSTGGIASGPITFMETFDQSTSTVIQGGMRRGAQMGVLRIDHPDVIYFIHAKNKDVSLAHSLRLDDPDDPRNTGFGEALEEARGLIEDGKVPKHLRNAVEGHLSNFNISVAVSDRFMDNLKQGKDHTFINPRTGEPHVATEYTKEMYEWFDLGDYVEVGEVLEIPSSVLWNRIVEGAWENGEPGVVFLDRANQTYSFDVEEYPEHEILSCNPCITGDTRVAVADGRKDVKVEDLAKEGMVPVFTHNEESGEIEVRDARAFKTGEGEDTITISTDGEVELNLTPDHEVYTNNRGWIEAKDLEVGDSLYIISCWNTNKFGSGSSRYRVVRSSKGNRYAEHRLIAEKFHSDLGEYKGNDDDLIVHHKDHDSLNNSPENLEVMSVKEHALLHDISGKNNPIYKLKERGDFEEWKENNPFYDVEGENNPMWGSDRTVRVDFTCEECGTTKEVPPHVRDNRKFCSPECRIESRRETDSFVCEYCGDVNYDIPSVASIRKYCNRECFLRDFSLTNEGRETLSERMIEDNPMYDPDIAKKSTINTDYDELSSKISDKREEMFENGELEKKVVQKRDSVECRVCGEEFKAITNTHLNTHDMTIEEYEEKYPNAEMRTKVVSFVKNHKVVSIEDGVTSDVYDLSVPDTHNFFCGSNVIENPESDKRTYIKISNCSEEFLEEYDACNLCHINLSTIVRKDRELWNAFDEQRGDLEEKVDWFLDQAVDWEELDHRIEYGVRFLDNVVTMSDFPIEKISERVRNVRNIGLGIMGLAHFYIQTGVRYGSEPANEVARQLMTYINHRSKEVSYELTQERGAFPEWDESKYSNPTEYPEWFEFRTGMEAKEWEDGFPQRNHQTTMIAPTGSTSMVANTSGGCEPIYNVVHYKNVSPDVQGDEMLVEFDDYFRRVLEANGIDVEEAKSEAVELMESNSFEGPESLSMVPDEIGELFVTAGDLSGKEHASVQCSLQEGVDSAISKTLNFPNEATVGDVDDVYEYVYDNGGKSIAVYRDGSRTKQVLTTRKDNVEFDEDAFEDKVEEEFGMDVDSLRDAVESVKEGFSGERDQLLSEEKEPVRTSLTPRERPDAIEGQTYKISTGYGGLYVTINEDEEGLFEVFAYVGKSGGLIQSHTESIARLVSLAFRSGVDPEEVIEQLSGIRSPEVGWDHGDTIHSIPDGIAVALQRHIEGQKDSVSMERVIDSLVNDGGSPDCPNCGSALQMSEGCEKCSRCGYSKC